MLIQGREISIVCFVVYIGRKLMVLWIPDFKVHELYTAACGLYVCWLAIRGVTIVSQWIPLGWNSLLQKLHEWCAVVSHGCCAL